MYQFPVVLQSKSLWKLSGDDRKKKTGNREKQTILRLWMSNQMENIYRAAASTTRPTPDEKEKA
jgi:hypothetical protein